MGIRTVEEEVGGEGGGGIWLGERREEGYG